MLGTIKGHLLPFNELETIEMHIQIIYNVILIN